MFDVVRLTKNDYDDLLAFLDSAFSCKEGDGFLVKLPVMWRKTDEAMSKHIAIKDNGKIIACMGIYPLNVKVGNKFLTFATTGNVAVDSEYRSKGLMKILMNKTDEILVNMGVDVARLGGERQRYNRYGFEYAGENVYFTLTKKNILSGVYGKGENYNSNISFKKVNKDNGDLIDVICSFQQSLPFYVDRKNNKDFFDIMCAWKNIPYVAIENNRVIGAVVCSQDKNKIAEIYGENEKSMFDIVCAFVIQNGIDYVTFNVPAYQKEFVRLLSDLCEYVSVGYSTQIKVINYARFIDGLIELKRLTEKDFCKVRGNFNLKIQDYGTVNISSKGCKLSKSKPHLAVDKLTANRLLFGYLKADEVVVLGKKENVIKSILPLPFWWNGQDRV